MIDRIESIVVNNFRGLSGTHDINLDADVVLVHGANGTGKTCLLSAIEFAITGSVEHLRYYDGDYPRCLRSIRSSSGTSVELAFRDKSGKSFRQKADVSGERLVRSNSISVADARFFSERCYLSQSHLSRLLEIYQAVNQDSPEQPLVRFVRELLNLDFLENLTTGLFEVADVRRISKATPAYQALRDTKVRIATQIEKSAAEYGVLSERWENAKLVATTLANEKADPSPESDWDLEGIRTRLGIIESNADVVAQERWQHDNRTKLDVLLRSRDFIVAGAKSLGDTISKFAIRRSTVESELKNAETILRDLISQMPSVDASENSGERVSGDVLEALDRIERSAMLVLERNRDRLSVVSSEREAFEALEIRSGELTGGLVATGDVIVTSLGANRTLQGALSAIVQSVSGEICPVCDRNFSETSQGTLREHLIAKLDALGTNLEKVEGAFAKEAAIKNELAVVNEQMRLFRSRDFSKELAAIQEAVTIASTVISTLSEVKNLREAVSAKRRQVVEFRSEQVTLEVRDRQRVESQSRVIQIADDLEIPTHQRPSEIEQLIAVCQSRLHARIADLESKIAARAQLLQALKHAEVAGVALKENERVRAELDLQALQIQVAEQRAEVCIDSGRRLSKAATEAKTRILQELFNDTLNKLWVDLFQRLSRMRAPFEPQLVQPKPVRGSIRAEVRGIANGVEPFAQLASVLSAGTLNTAALSLFLALHLVEVPRHRLLILDDPVQNMDDVHVVQLASLLRTLVRQEQRQLFIAVHERTLFEYLRVELGPARPKDRLIAIELDYDLELRKCSISNSPSVWKNDSLRFGDRKQVG